jgi:hypothetical protein
VSRDARGELPPAAQQADRARQAGREGNRSEAEEVLLADALAVRLVLARMEEAVQHGVRERLP